MSDAALAVGGLMCGCQANVFLLELIKAGNPDIFYFLTFAQYVVVTLLSIPFMYTIDVSPHRRRLLPLRLRPMRLLTLHKIIISSAAWVMSVSSNLVFSFYISVPVHSTFRSMSLLLNMLVGHLYLGKQYTLLQVMCVATISCSLVILTVEKSRKLQGKTETAEEAIPDELFWWLCGAVILALTTIFSTGLSILQERMYSVARSREKEREEEAMKKKDITTPLLPSPAPSPMWAEALFFSHAFGIPLFFLNPQRLFSELLSVSSNNYTYFVLNAITQYICVTAVYVLNERTSSFTVVLTLTLRKLGTFVISVVYFGHYWNFSVLEWAAMLAALAGASLYPLLPKARGMHHSISGRLVRGNEINSPGPDKK